MLLEVKTGSVRLFVGILVALLCAYSALSNQFYNVTSAIEYAKRWCKSRNPQYSAYSADCANFVSQCLIAGDIDMSHYPGVTKEGTIISCTLLHDFLVSYLKVQHITLYKDQPEPSWLSPGDVAIFHYLEDPSEWTPSGHPVKHAVFAVARINGRIRFSAHTGDVCGHNVSKWDHHTFTKDWFFENGGWRYCTYYHVSQLSPVPASTATVLVMDVSGSMAWRWRGGVKIESAKRAALQFIEQVANEPRPPGSTHMIGVVTFSEAKDTVIKLGTLTSTNLGAGLDSALQELEKVPSARRFIILLSDGMTNTGKTRDQILSSSVATARRRGICIHTVGFGDPGDIDEEFLRRVAADSGCGSYNYAASGFELFGTYVKIRHRMLGSNRVVEFSSGPSPVRLLAGQSVSLGAFQLTAPARELHYTLTWSAPGRMRAILVDPSNRTVTTRYPGAMVYYGGGFMHITVLSPKSGIWRVSAAAITPFIQGVQYYGVASARTGGVVIPYRMPIPCIEILGTEICIPVPDLPTVLVVGTVIVVAAIMVYLQLIEE